jgi:DNA-binding XRE family transcriptional regulator
MIKNEKQYKISKNRLAEMDEIIRKKKNSILPGSKEEGAINSLLLIRNDIKIQIRQYEQLKNKAVSLKKQVSLIQLPQILIEHKISRGLTQKEFSKILGIKEQQLQRYEADNYNSVSFGRLLEYIEKAKIKIKLAVEKL